MGQTHLNSTPQPQQISEEIFNILKLINGMWNNALLFG